MRRGSARAVGQVAPFARTIAPTFRRRFHPGSGRAIRDGERCLIDHCGRSAVDFATPGHRFRPAIRRLQGRSSAIDFCERVLLLRLVRRLPCLLPRRERATTHAAGVGQALTGAAVGSASNQIHDRFFICADQTARLSPSDFAYSCPENLPAMPQLAPRLPAVRHGPWPE
jgi:hypothetical protein